MSSKISRAQLVGGWFAAVVVLFALSVVQSASTATIAGELWVAACVVPPVVLLLVWPSPPAVTVAELLHAVDTPVGAGRR